VSVPKIRVNQLTIRLRGVSPAEARRAVDALGPALARQLSAARPATTVGKQALADRIAAPLAARVRGGKA